MPFDKKAYYIEYSKKYYEANKDKKKEYSNIIKHCPICNGDYRQGNKTNHIRSNIHKIKEMEKTINDQKNKIEKLKKSLVNENENKKDEEPPKGDLKEILNSLKN